MWMGDDIIRKSPLASSLEEEEAGLDLGGNQESLPFRYFRSLQCDLPTEGGAGHGWIERKSEECESHCRECGW